MRVVAAIALLAVSALAQESDPVRQAAQEVVDLAAKERPPLGIDTRVRAADALSRIYPDLSQRLARECVHDLQLGSSWAFSGDIVETLARLAPADAEAIKRLLAAPRKSSGAPPPSPPNENSREIQRRIGQLRSDLTKADRARLAIGLAETIRNLPDDSTRLALAGSLANLSTEGDLGEAPLQAVADTLAFALQKARPNSAGGYLTLAKMIRYERLKPPVDDASIEAKLALLRLRDLLYERSDFRLTALDGRSYTLRELRGQVVLLNFWATWCPPCRKEMPDLEKLHRRFRDKGLAVLAVTDEAPEKVAPFIQKGGYTFPILLDAGRAVNAAYNIEGIPKTFVFDRNGKLAAQSIDMRTEEQFLAMLKQAGL